MYFFEVTKLKVTINKNFAYMHIAFIQLVMATIK